MPDTRAHRGPAPKDAELFASSRVPTLRAATAELSWLLGRGYAAPSALELVGNRHQLVSRQRAAVSRAACTDAQRARRAASRRAIDALEGAELAIDAFNAIIVAESALSGGLVVLGRDRAQRDLASVHGTWRRVSETARALEQLADIVIAARPRRVRWLLDAPVGNSGRLAAMLRDLAAARGVEWEVELVASPDRALAAHDGVVASADAWILDHARAWADLPASLEAAWRIDLGEDS